jgi:hypothetical protein
MYEVWRHGECILTTEDYREMLKVAKTGDTVKTQLTIDWRGKD